MGHSLPFARAAGGAGLLTVILATLQACAALTSPGSGDGILTALTLLSLAVWEACLFGCQRSKLGRLGSFAAAAAIMGTLGLAALSLPSSLSFPGVWSAKVLSGRWEPVPTCAFPVLFTWGILGLGTETLRVGALPRGATALWMVGLLVSIVTSWVAAGAVAAVGIIWSSVIMLRSGCTQPSTSASDPRDSPTQGTGRLVPLDALRGTLMILMAIDHASLFVRRWHPFETWDRPLPDYPNLAAMLTRLVTHPCAPGFYFLMGAGMLLFAEARRKSGWSNGKIAGHLALRGLLLITLEQLVVDLATAGQPTPLDFSILAGLGAVMLLGIPALRLSAAIQASLGAAIVLAMQVLPGMLRHANLGLFTPIRLLLLPGAVGPAFVLYPPLPWLGVALLGMAFARLVLAKPAAVYRWALVAGLSCLALFPLVRGLGGFGNLRMPSGGSVIDFVNVVKYPPSLSFLLLALGINLILLYAASRAARRLVLLAAFGRAALYFFLVHWFVYAALARAWPRPAGLPETYLAWIAGLILLYPVCKSYESFKHGMPISSAWRMI